MQFFYDGQIRRYLVQTIRVFSNFVVKYGDGSLHRIPVMYGDADRQVASIIRANSENKVNSVPRIAVYITGLELDTSRLGDATYVGKVNVRERDFNPGGSYSQGQGRNYTVERLMPTPFKLSMKVDIWTANTEQKLQVMEQLLVLFNPSLEIQTTDNYIDWTSLTVLNLTSINWDSRTVPVGTDTPIDIGTLSVETPIWISPPVKVKRLGVIQKIITSLYGSEGNNTVGYIEGLGNDLADTPTPGFSDLLAETVVTVANYGVQVYNNQAILIPPGITNPATHSLDPTPRPEITTNWQAVLDQYPGKFFAGSSRLYLLQPNGSEIVGTIAVNPLDNVLLNISWDPDTLTTNTGVDSQGKLDFEIGYNPTNRSNSPGTFDAIVNPLTFNPGDVAAGTRYLIIEDIGDAQTIIDGNASTVWGELVALANDIIEWNGTAWTVIFASSQFPDTMIWQTNIYTGVQYTWNGIQWNKSFEGEYGVGQWRLEL